MRRFLPVGFHQVLLGSLACALGGFFWIPARAEAPLELAAKPERSDGTFRYVCELRNPNVRAVEILSFKVTEISPWQFEYRSKRQPGLSEGRKSATVPYLVFDATSDAREKMLVILPEEKASSRMPPWHDAKDGFSIVSGGSIAFGVDFPARPTWVVLTYYLRDPSGELRRCRLSKRFP